MILNKIIKNTILFFFSISFAHECIEISPNDYGDCEMALGVAWTINGCEAVSGCDWVDSNGNNNIELFYPNIYDCQLECTNHIGILGDLNSDEITNVLDVVILVNIVLNQIIPSPHSMWSGDVNFDNLLNVLDIVKIVGMIINPNTDNRATWSIISEDILEPRCAGSCHASGTYFAEQTQLVLTSDVSYSEIINTTPINSSAISDSLVQISNDGGLYALQKSYLWEKINIRDQEHYYSEHPYYGELMPLGGPFLTNGQLNFIKSWIMAGAPDTGIVSDITLLTDTTIYSVPEFVIPEPPDYGIQLHLGPFDVPINSEREILSYIDPGFTEDVFIKRIKINMRPGSHHFILYTFTNIPNSFLPPEGIIRDYYDQNGNYINDNIMATQFHKFVSGTQWPELDYHFPQGIALRFPAGHGFDQNSHYTNYTNQPLIGEIYTNLYFAEQNEIDHIAEILMLNNTNFSLPPNQITTIERTYWGNQLGLNENNQIKIFQLFSHAHQHMIRFDVEIIYNNNSSELVYTALDWEHPPILNLIDPIIITAEMGIKLKATYDNWTNDTIGYGLLSVDEMMILFGYYYID